MKDARGSVLIVALWSMAFLGALAIQIGSQAMMRLTAARHLVDRSQSTQEAWGAFEEAYGKIRANPNPTGPFSGTGYQVTDVSSRISINGASLEVLQNLVEHVRDNNDDSAERIAAAIVDWRDEDDDPLPNGAESSAYAYGCKSAPFECIEELLLVRGITFDLFQKMKNQVTVSPHATVNLNTSSQEVLESVGMSPSLAEKVVAYTRGADGALGTDDDQLFDAVGVFPSVLADQVGLSSDEQSEATELANAGIFSVRNSPEFLITARSTTSNSLVREIVAVVDSNGKILSWNER